MQASDPEAVAIREILLNWARLSPGDISTLHAALGTDEARIGTIVGSANGVMWESFERLGWATRVFPALLQPSAGKRPAFFTLTSLGRNLHRAIHYAIVNFLVDKLFKTSHYPAKSKNCKMWDNQEPPKTRAKIVSTCFR